MKIKTSEATGATLDWLVGCALDAYIPCAVPEYSTDWAQGGPIIEREFMDVEVTPCSPDQGAPYDTWRAWKHNDNADATVVCGPTPLIAAMRCYVVSKLGEEVEVPDELV
jgi:hypothetical protein